MDLWVHVKGLSLILGTAFQNTLPPMNPFFHLHTSECNLFFLKIKNEKDLNNS